MTYQEKKDLRIARLTRAVSLCKAESIRANEQASKMADVIPFGQPILVGHHSEKRDRNYRERIQRRFEKAFELQKKAEYYQDRLSSALSNNSISSDDPEAVQLLKEKLAKLEKMQDNFKTTNKIIKRKTGTQEEKQKELEAAFPNSKPETLAALFKPDFCGRIGIADYNLTNNNGNMRRIKQRIEHLSRHAKDETKERTVNGVKIIDNVEENRLQLFFPGKPAQEVIEQLKGGGFHWSHYCGCWQRMRSNAATWSANHIVDKLAVTPAEVAQC